MTASRSPILPCIGCGYELYGLDLSGACPECGRAIEHTLKPTPETQPGKMASRRAMWLSVAASGCSIPAFYLSPLLIVASLYYAHRAWRMTRNGRLDPAERSVILLSLAICLFASIVCTVMFSAIL